MATAEEALILAAAVIETVKDLLGKIAPDRFVAEKQLLATATTSINTVVAAIPDLKNLAPGDLATWKAGLEQLLDRLAANDKSADEALDKKFDPGDNSP